MTSDRATTDSITIAGVVLGAGAGTRFEGTEHKLLANFNGAPLASWAIEAAIEAGFNQLYVVSGAIDLEAELRETLGQAHSRVTWLTCQDWASGQSQSLQVGVAAARSDGHSAVVVGLADQPMIPASAWRSIGASRGAITIAEFDGVRTPPVKLESSVWGLLPSEGDLGAREVIKSYPELVSAVPCAGKAADIDTERDLKRWS